VFTELVPKAAEVVVALFQQGMPSDGVIDSLLFMPLHWTVHDGGHQCKLAVSALRCHQAIGSVGCVSPGMEQAESLDGNDEPTISEVLTARIKEKKEQQEKQRKDQTLTRLKHAKEHSQPHSASKSKSASSLVTNRSHNPFIAMEPCHSLEEMHTISPTDSVEDNEIEAQLKQLYLEEQKSLKQLVAKGAPSTSANAVAGAGTSGSGDDWDDWEDEVKVANQGPGANNAATPGSSENPVSSETSPISELANGQVSSTAAKTKSESKAQRIAAIQAAMAADPPNAPKASPRKNSADSSNVSLNRSDANNSSGSSGILEKSASKKNSRDNVASNNPNSSLPAGPGRVRSASSATDGDASMTSAGTSNSSSTMDHVGTSPTSGSKKKKKKAKANNSGVGGFEIPETVSNTSGEMKVPTLVVPGTPPMSGQSTPRSARGRSGSSASMSSNANSVMPGMPVGFPRPDDFSGQSLSRQNSGEDLNNKRRNSHNNNNVGGNTFINIAVSNPATLLHPVVTTDMMVPTLMMAAQQAPSYPPPIVIKTGSAPPSPLLTTNNTVLDGHIAVSSPMLSNEFVMVQGKKRPQIPQLNRALNQHQPQSGRQQQTQLYRTNSTNVNSNAGHSHPQSPVLGSQEHQGPGSGRQQRSQYQQGPQGQQGQQPPGQAVRQSPHGPYPQQQFEPAYATVAPLQHPHHAPPVLPLPLPLPPAPPAPPGVQDTKQHYKGPTPSASPSLVSVGSTPHTPTSPSVSAQLQTPLQPYMLPQQLSQPFFAPNYSQPQPHHLHQQQLHGQFQQQPQHQMQYQQHQQQLPVQQVHVHPPPQQHYHLHYVVDPVTGAMIAQGPPSLIINNASIPPSHIPNIPPSHIPAGYMGNNHNNYHGQNQPSARNDNRQRRGGQGYDNNGNRAYSYDGSFNEQPQQQQHQQYQRQTSARSSSMGQHGNNISAADRTKSFDHSAHGNIINSGSNIDSARADPNTFVFADSPSSGRHHQQPHSNHSTPRAGNSGGIANDGNNAGHSHGYPHMDANSGAANSNHTPRSHGYQNQMHYQTQYPQQAAYQTQYPNQFQQQPHMHGQGHPGQGPNQSFKQYSHQPGGGHGHVDMETLANNNRQMEELAELSNKSKAMMANRIVVSHNSYMQANHGNIASNNSTPRNTPSSASQAPGAPTPGREETVAPLAGATKAVSPTEQKEVVADAATPPPSLTAQRQHLQTPPAAPVSVKESPDCQALIEERKRSSVVAIAAMEKERERRIEVDSIAREQARIEENEERASRSRLAQQASEEERARRIQELNKGNVLNDLERSRRQKWASNQLVMEQQAQFESHVTEIQKRLTKNIRHFNKVGD
jgi:hypothetical protein